jgi:hypothetical protein
MLGQLIFNESVYDDKQYLEHCSDDNFSLYKYTKDRTFDTLRRDLIIEDLDYLPITKRINKYIESKNRYKILNSKLHESLYKSSTTLNRLINDFKLANIIKMPKQFKINNITHARFLQYDGNIKELLFENPDNYFLFCYNGS